MSQPPELWQKKPELFQLPGKDFKATIIKIISVKMKI